MTEVELQKQRQAANDAAQLAKIQQSAAYQSDHAALIAGGSAKPAAPPQADSSAWAAAMAANAPGGGAGLGAGATPATGATTAPADQGSYTGANFEGSSHDPRMWTHADHPEGFTSSKDYGQIAGYLKSGGNAEGVGNGFTYKPVEYGKENFDPAGGGGAAVPPTAATPPPAADGGGGTGDVLSPSMTSLTGGAVGAAPQAGAAMGALQEPGGSLLRPTLVTRHPAVMSASLAQLGKAY